MKAQLKHRFYSTALLLQWIALGIFTINMMNAGGLVKFLYFVAFVVVPVGIGYYLSYAFRKDENEKN